MPAGRLPNSFLSRLRFLSALRLSNRPAGRVLNWLLYRRSSVSALRLSKIPAGRVVKAVQSNLSVVSALRLSKMPAGRLLNPFSAKMSVVSALRLSKMPAGRLRNSFCCRLRFLSVLRLSKMRSGNAVKSLAFSQSDVSDDRPEKSPAFSEVIDSLDRLRLVIAARSASVTSLAELTPSVATIASRTCGVRSLTGMKKVPPSSVNTSGRSIDLKSS